MQQEIHRINSDNDQLAKELQEENSGLHLEIEKHKQIIEEQNSNAREFLVKIEEISGEFEKVNGCYIQNQKVLVATQKQNQMLHDKINAFITERDFNLQKIRE